MPFDRHDSEKQKNGAEPLRARHEIFLKNSISYQEGKAIHERRGTRVHEARRKRDEEDFLVKLTTIHQLFSLFAQKILKIASEKKRAFARKREISRALKF